MAEAQSLSEERLRQLNLRVMTLEAQLALLAGAVRILAEAARIPAVAEVVTEEVA